MEKTVFIIMFFTLFLSCLILIAAQGKSASTFSRFRKNNLRKVTKTQFKNTLFDPSELHIDESRLISTSSQTSGENKENDRIMRLPGQPNVVKFKQYGGYVKVNPKTGKSFYYYFVEAQESPETSPLLLWINGEPACSSLGYGAMQELGPFRVQSDGKTLYVNEYAWNQVANVLFLETPTGVGFSYSNTTSDYVIGDKIIASDNYVFLINWLEKFPEYKTRDVYLSGESYAGHYVPQLAQTILYQNKRAKTIVKLKGIMIGNPVINHGTDDQGVFEYWGSHALISDNLTNQILRDCGFSPKGPCQIKACNKDIDEAWETFNHINVYNIYWPLCHNDNLTDKPNKYSILEFDPCSENYVHAYLNRPDVQKALHANVTKIPHAWEFCSDVDLTEYASTVLPSLKEFMKNGLQVWIYSGDVDGRIPVTATQLSIKEMNLPIKEHWHPWSSNKNDVGGYIQVYEGNLAFVTIRGAGHDVPSYQPQRALVLVTHFLNGVNLFYT